MKGKEREGREGKEREGRKGNEREGKNGRERKGGKEKRNGRQINKVIQQTYLLFTSKVSFDLPME